MKKLLILLLLATATAVRAEVTLPAIFGDNMVLQQNGLARIWGHSDAREVLLTPSWSEQTLRAEVHNGRWSADVPTPAGSFTPWTLRIADATSEYVLQNILIGEVWICSGQSNMDMPLRGYTGQPVEGAMRVLLETPQMSDRIRMITLPRNESDIPQTNFEGAWTVPSLQTAPKMSAVAYFFARTLTLTLGVPVGIVSTSWGGSKIEAWTDAESLRELGYDVKRINADKKIAPLAQCTKLYNGMIAPVAGFTARGFAWYQGESNRKESAIYASLMQAMVAYWRAQWNDAEARMPFLYVQIAPYVYDDAAATDAVQVVEAQYDALKLIPNSALVPTTDIGQAECIHPRKKHEVGERLATEALVCAYGMKLPDCSGVRYRNAEFRDGKAVVTFDNARNGLIADGKQVTGFELAGADGVFYPAAGRIVGPKSSEVEVTSEQVAQPVAVRYAFRNYIPANLANTMGWPAFPFRTDRK